MAPPAVREYTRGMQIKNPEVFSMIETIGQHYRANISNRFTRSVLSDLNLDAAAWVQIEELTERAENYQYQGYHLDELYSMIMAIARFVAAARKQAAQTLRRGIGSDRLSGQDKVLRDMVVNNFSSNLNILADSVNKLFLKVIEIDKSEASERGAVYQKFPELQSIGRYLVE